MAGLPFPSDNPAADRRADYAEALAREGDLAAAIEVMTGALDLAPLWAAGWYRLGEYLERAGRLREAADAWARALDADPADLLGAGPKRDLALGNPLSESLPPAFVELLFDQYAPRFEHSLVEKLGYTGPQVIMDGLRAAGFVRAARAQDLGCGTGLMGELLRPYCDRLEGCDLSAAMLAAARRKGLYDRLDKADLAALEIEPDAYDLIVAADVFAYVGALERIIAWCAGSLASGGYLAFTVEAGTEPVELRDSRRFAHSRDYLSGLLSDAGFAAVTLSDCVVRKDRGADIASYCVIAAKAAARHSREDDGEAQIPA